MYAVFRLKQQQQQVTKEYIEHVAACHSHCRDCGIPRKERLMQETYCQTCLTDYPVCDACLGVEDVRNVYVDQWYNCKCCRFASCNDALASSNWPKSVCTQCQSDHWDHAKRDRCNTCGNNNVVLCDRCDPTPPHPSLGKCCVRGAASKKNGRPLLHQCTKCQEAWEADDRSRGREPVVNEEQTTETKRRSRKRTRSAVIETYRGDATSYRTAPLKMNFRLGRTPLKAILSISATSSSSSSFSPNKKAKHHYQEQAPVIKTVLRP